MNTDYSYFIFFLLIVNCNSKTEKNMKSFFFILMFDYDNFSQIYCCLHPYHWIFFSVFKLLFNCVSFVPSYEKKST